MVIHKSDSEISAQIRAILGSNLAQIWPKIGFLPNISAYTHTICLEWQILIGFNDI